MNAKIKAVEAERDKVLANLNEALKSEASALEAKSEAEKIKQDYSRLVDSEVAKAAEKGNAVAENMLSVMYYNGRGVTEDKARSKEFARRAAIHGSAAGQYNYACDLEDEKNYAEAKVFYEMSAEQDYISQFETLAKNHYIQLKGELDI